MIDIADFQPLASVLQRGRRCHRVCLYGQGDKINIVAWNIKLNIWNGAV